MKKLMSFFLILTIAVSAFAQAEKKNETNPTRKPDANLTTAAAKPAPAAETKTVNPNAPKIRFETETHDFGPIPEGPQATHEFKFTNTGKEPLILSNVKASCGCTTPSWPKEPILPGKDGVITATYNTQGRPGPFTKTITITSNADEATKVINIKGEVLKAEAEKTVPVAKPSMLSPAGSN